MNKPIFLVGGGTGGHVFPVVAVAQELQRQQIPFLLIGSRNSIEEPVYRQIDSETVIIRAGKLRRYINIVAVIQNCIDFFWFVVGIAQSVGLILSRRPSAVFSKGGFVALPVIIAAKICRVPLYIHESDAVIGFTNKIAVGWAKKVFCAFDLDLGRNSFKIERVGIPVRRAFYETQNTTRSKPQLLILPGSLGSTWINNVLKPQISSLVKLCSIVHVTGEKQFEEFYQLSLQFEQHEYRAFRFISAELPELLASTDIVLARSSATITAECAVGKKAMIQVPLPNAAQNHQRLNAQILAKNGAIILVDQELDGAGKLMEQIHFLLTSVRERERLGLALYEFFGKDTAVARITEELIKCREKHLK